MLHGAATRSRWSTLWTRIGSFSCPTEFLAKNVAKETGKQIIIPSAAEAEAGCVDESESAAVLLEPRASGHRDRETGHAIIPLETEEFDLIGWHGRCEVHDKFTVDDIQRVRAEFPDVVILSHPECSPEVVAASDFAGSTSAMIRHVEQTTLLAICC